jgi:hypothetical protein
MYLWTIAGFAVGTFVVWLILFNRRGRRREREQAKQRGSQSATDFALLFNTPTQCFIAEKLFPYLQMGTFSHQVSFRKDDRLWEPPLSFVRDQVADNLGLGFWDEIDLGLTAEGSSLGDVLAASVATVGELVEAISALYAERHGLVENRQR